MPLDEVEKHISTVKEHLDSMANNGNISPFGKVFTSMWVIISELERVRGEDA